MAITFHIVRSFRRQDDFEFNLPRPSYTINTLENLKKIYLDRDFTLIIGSDNWYTFPRWKDAERIRTENKIMIYPRLGYKVDNQSLPLNVKLVEPPLFEVSSTFIRESLDKGKDVRFFMHPEAYRFLQEELSKD